MPRPLRLPLLAVLAALTLVPLYLAGTVLGAAIPARPAESWMRGPEATIYMVNSPLHADFAIPVTRHVRALFAPLAGFGLPMENPRLEYLVFGWGSKAFYTTAPTLSDIRLEPTLAAVFGDSAVLHVTAAGDVARLGNAYRVDLPPGGLDRLVRFIAASFALDGEGRPVPLVGVAYGKSDRFFEANGHFNILTPCNVWAARGLREAGVSTGIWTPTTHALRLGLRLHADQAVADPLF